MTEDQIRAMRNSPDRSFRPGSELFVAGVPVEVPSVLDEAKRIVEQRGKEYGSAVENFADIARMWSVILGFEVIPEQVAPMMIAVKLCRQKQKPKRDNMVDIAGFASKGQEVIDVLQAKQ